VLNRYSFKFKKQAYGGYNILDGTPLLDIKPFVPEFDTADNIAIGWLTGSRHKIIHSVNDGRFDANFKSEK